MKIWEISREEGKTYKATGEFDGTSVSYTVEVDTVGNLLCYDKLRIENKLSLNKILEMEFEEIVDWHKIPVDTKVLVSDDGESWYKEYFSHTLNTMFYTFDGGTSWNNKENTIGWSYCKLAED